MDAPPSRPRTPVVGSGRAGATAARPLMALPRTLAALVLAAAAAGGAWFLLGGRAGTPDAQPDGDFTDRPTGMGGDGGPTPIAHPKQKGALETFGPAPVPPSIPVDPSDPSVVARVRVGAPDSEGRVRGAEVAKALASLDGVEVRWETEEVRKEFLDVSLHLPPEAYTPPEEPMGAPLPLVAAAVGEAGFSARFVPPVLWIGAKR